jgi:hypothetical protein
MAAKNARGTDRRLVETQDEAPSRQSRDSADAERVTKDGTAMSVEERRKMLREELNQEILPKPPAVAGWHFCWLSTTNSTDPIYRRMRIGYVPVKAEELPGFSTQHQINGGEFDGCIRCNEMILFKIEEALYREIMLINHHEKPREEEEMIRDRAQKDEKDSKGRPLVEAEGFDVLGKAVPEPTFNA